MYKFEAKYNKKRAMAHIKRLMDQKVGIYYHSNASPNITWNKKARTGVLQDHNQQGKKTPNIKGRQ